ncbi:MAG: M15 family metallopeptidase [bacterium]
MIIPYWIYRITSIPYRQIIHVLPRKHWEHVSIQENDESLVVYDGFKIRGTVAQKIEQVKKQLPEGVYLKLLDGYRSLERQQQAWERKWSVVKSENPDWSDEQINQEVGLVVARPAGITNHVCGGAVDVCLVNDQGVMVDFGTEYGPADELGRSTCPMFSRNITTAQEQNRTILRKAMESAGFVWYPGEWWHYCFGDRMWAVYTGRTTCIYGPVSEYEK